MKHAIMANTIAQLTVETLIANGIDQLYCLPGVQNDEFFNALYDYTDRLVPIHTRHEQGAAYMAMGAALATGRPQVYCVVPGPGFLNTTAALSTAYAVNAPVLALAGQIPSGAIGKGHGLLHEIPDQLGVMQSLTKHATRVTGGESAPAEIQACFQALVSGRPQPVGLEIPVNRWTDPVNPGTNSLQAVRLQDPRPDTRQLDAAINLLQNAKCPMIVVGGGAQDFSPEVTRLAALLCAPVLSFRNGRGVLSSEDPLSIGMPVAHDLWPQVDVVLGLGTRLQSQQMAWGVDDDLSVIHIDIDATELGRFRQPEVAINANLADTLPLLLDGIEGKELRPSAWIEQVEKYKRQREQQYAERIGPQLEWLSAIRDVLPRSGIFVDELTQTGYVSRFTFPAYQPRTFLSTGYQGTLGYGFATALGAAHARRDVPVVSICGDGGALFTISEMATAVQHNIPLTSIVFNDNAFGNVRRLQTDNYQGRHIASDLSSPDFVKLSQSFGAQGFKATTPGQLRQCLEKAFNSPGPTLIEVPVGELPSPWEFVLMPKVRG